MTKFLDGPAAGVILMLRRAPLFLRVVRNPLAKKADSRWDALDQVVDTCKPHEEVHVYRRDGDAQRIHLLLRQRSASGFYMKAEYKHFDAQPTGDDVFLNEDWQAWCRRTYEHLNAG